MSNVRNLTSIEIGQRIKEKREQLGIMQKDLAEKIGVAASTIQRYETGTIKQYKLPIIDSIGKILNVDPTYFIKDVPETPYTLQAVPIDAPINIYESIKNYPDKSQLIGRINRRIKDGSQEKALKLTNYFFELNEDGQNEALKRISELTQLPQYSNDIKVNAAHDDNLTDEEKENADEILRKELAKIKK